MKTLKIIFLSAFILGLVIFQVNLTSEQGNPLSKSGMSLIAKAYGESLPGNYYSEVSTPIVCGTDYWEWTIYYNCSGVVVGSDCRVNNQTMYQYMGGYCFSKFESAYKDRMGSQISCAGGSGTCNPRSSCN